MSDLVVFDNQDQPLLRGGTPAIPDLFMAAGAPAAHRYMEFMAAEIRNGNTRAAYARAIARFSLWCDERGLELTQLTPVLVAAYLY